MNLVFLIELAVLYLVVDAVIFRSNGNDPGSESRQLGPAPRRRTTIVAVRPNFQPYTRHELSGIASHFAMQYLRFAM